ncbi:voltage-gated potassium channel [Aureococcus anophagefferens]|nr:voltage-gated potassium channel [Aureococcus anophagefferens]
MVVEGQPLCDPEPPPGRDSSPSRLSGVSGLPPQDVDAIEARASRERARRLARAQAQRGDVAEPAARRRLAADGRRGGVAAGGGRRRAGAALQETLAAMRTQMHVLGERLDALQSAALPVGAERPASASSAAYSGRPVLRRARPGSFDAGFHRRATAPEPGALDVAGPSHRRATAPDQSLPPGLLGGMSLPAALPPDQVPPHYEEPSPAMSFGGRYSSERASRDRRSSRDSRHSRADGPIDPGAKPRERRPTIASIYHGHRCGWDTSEDAQRLEQLLKGPQRGSDGAQAANFFAALDARTIVRSRSRAKVAWDVLLVFVAAHEAFAAPLLWAFGDRTTYAPHTLLALVVLLLYAIHWSACCWVVIMSEPFKAQFGFYECAGSSADFCESCESPGWDARACFDCCDKDPIGMRDACARSMVHATSLLFALGTFMPEAFGEQVFFVCIIVLGGLLSASIFGAFAVVVGEVFAGENNVQARISATSTQMARMHIPRPMRKRVHDYQRHMAKLEESGATVFTKDSFMSDLSPALRGDLKLYLFLETIAQNVFFLKANPSQQLLGMIVEGLYTAVYMPGGPHHAQGRSERLDGLHRHGRRDRPPLYDTRRTMDVEAVGHCRIHVLSRSTLDRMREAYPKETLSLITSIKSDVELKKRLSIEEIAALKKDTIVADIRKKMLASVVQDQSYTAESKRQKRASGHAGKRGEESKEPTTDPVPARSLDEKTVADLAADAAAAFD